MASDLITVVLFGHPDPDIATKLSVPDTPATEADGFQATSYADDRNLPALLAETRPHVIFTFGDVASYPRLGNASLEMRRRWVHYAEPPAPADLARTALTVFVDIATNDRFPELPLVSVYTPTYCTGPALLRPYRSLLAQTYNNWEWVVYDDSPDDATFRQLQSIAESEPRVRLFRGDRNCGVIGEVKRRLCGLARGKLLVELDHDDELTATCLADVIEAFRTFPDAGFAFTDCAEVFDDGQLGSYPEGWGFGFGSYRTESYRGKDYYVTNYPSINSKTMRHIIGVPNHVRAWTRDAYNKIGGYGSEIHVCDDYEILIRTFLTTRMVHIQRFGYIQYLQHSGGNTQRKRNKEIQRLVRLFHQRYETQIHDRFVELGVDDFIWRDGQLDWAIANPSPSPIANYILR